MAHALTAARLLLVVPVSLAFARPAFLTPLALLLLLVVAIATDYGDGRIARRRGTASAGGRLFDHTTDFLFVTTGLAGAAVAGHLTPVLPVVITIAFVQYGLDSYWLYQQKQLRMSRIGRWNGIFYFVPLVVIAVARLSPFSGVTEVLMTSVSLLGYGLVLSTAVSVVDRAVAPLRGRAGQPS